MARESIEQTLAKSREGVKERRTETQVGKGDMVMLWNCARHDALDPRNDGPYEVLDKKGPDVKIRIRKQARVIRSSLTHYIIKSDKSNNCGCILAI